MRLLLAFFYVILMSCAPSNEGLLEKETNDVSPCQEAFVKGRTHFAVGWALTEEAGRDLHAARQFREAAYHYSTAVIECESYRTRELSRRSALTSTQNVWLLMRRVHK